MLPTDAMGLTGMSYDNTGELGASTWRHVAFVEQERPLRVQGRTVHQIGLPFHWGPNGYTTGDAANELSSVVLDPNVHIQEAKAATCDIRPGRAPRGAIA